MSQSRLCAKIVIWLPVDVDQRGEVVVLLLFSAAATVSHGCSVELKNG